jgi:sialic acid synthase SpsE
MQAAEALIIEKHATLNRNAEGPDHFSSLAPYRFGRCVPKARRTRASLGESELETSMAES